MKRRDLITLFGGAVWPLAARGSRRRVRALMNNYAKTDREGHGFPGTLAPERVRVEEDLGSGITARSAMRTASEKE